MIKAKLSTNEIKISLSKILRIECQADSTKLTFRNHQNGLTNIQRVPLNDNTKGFIVPETIASPAICTNNKQKKICEMTPRVYDDIVKYYVDKGGHCHYPSSSAGGYISQHSNTNAQKCSELCYLNSACLVFRNSGSFCKLYSKDFKCPYSSHGYMKKYKIATDYYRKLASNQKCSDNEKVGDATTESNEVYCDKMCFEEQTCKYFTYQASSKSCQLYKDCTALAASGLNIYRSTAKYTSNCKTDCGWK